jgi:hypothetical protein
MFEAQSKRFDCARVFAILGNACLRNGKRPSTAQTVELSGLEPGSESVRETIAQTVLLNTKRQAEALPRGAWAAWEGSCKLRVAPKGA